MIKPVQVTGMLLLVGGLGYLAIYGFTVLVALATSGSELVIQPQAWYAALAPLIYSSYCIFTVLAAPTVTVKGLLITGIILGVLAVPTLSVSFLGYGKYLPLLTILWGLFIFFLSKAPHTTAPSLPLRGWDAPLRYAPLALDVRRKKSTRHLHEKRDMFADNVCWSVYGWPDPSR